MEKQIVQSYVRVRPNKQAPDQPEQSNFMGYLLGGGAVTILALNYMAITLAFVALAGAVYGMKLVYMAPKPVATVEAVTEAQDKPKRHYQRRLKVNMYDTGKTIRI